MRQLFFLSLFLAIGAIAKTQFSDTANLKAPANWKKMELAPRIAFGTQRAFYFEAGAALQKYIYEPRHGFVANAIYTCFEWTVGKAGEKSIVGAKIGAESVFNGSTGGIEIKYLTNGDDDDIVITPKLGFGIGAATLFYGYNFSTNKYPYERIRKHQFSLAINTNLLFYNSKYEKK